MRTIKTRWAIVGTSDVAAKFILGLRYAPGAEAALVVSRSAERGAALAGALGVARSTDSYEDAAAASDIDAVYIATPPSRHRDDALLFIAGKKPVLIEKPFASSSADAEAIILAAKAAGVFCMEGMWTRFLPAMETARNLIANGAIGEPRSLFASFAIAEIVDPANSFFRPELGGGAVNHRGVYPVSLALDLLGPATLSAAAVLRGETGIDEEATALLRHENNAISNVYVSARTVADNTLAVHGTEGTLRFAGPIYRPFGIKLEPVRPRHRKQTRWSRTAMLKQGALLQNISQRISMLGSRSSKSRLLRAPYMGNGYTHEAIAVMRCLAEGKTEHPQMPLSASLAIVRLMDEIRAAGTLAS